MDVRDEEDDSVLLENYVCGYVRGAYSIIIMRKNEATLATELFLTRFSCARHVPSMSCGKNTFV